MALIAVVIAVPFLATKAEEAIQIKNEEFKEKQNRECYEKAEECMDTGKTLPKLSDLTDNTNLKRIVLFYIFYQSETSVIISRFACTDLYHNVELFSGTNNFSAIRRKSKGVSFLYFSTSVSIFSAPPNNS